jgi:hypothetical protein
MSKRATVDLMVVLSAARGDTPGMDEDILAKVAKLVAEEKALENDAETAPERVAHRARIEAALD